MEKVEEKVLDLFKEKETLFIENDWGLYNTVGVLEQFLIENKCQYHTILDLERISMEVIISTIEMHDIIVFESQYVGERAQELLKFLYNDKSMKKKVVECYIHEPHWWRKPKGILSDMYVLTTSQEWDDNDFEEWEFNKLRVEKAIWEN